MKKIIGIDTETTGLLARANSPIEYQPYITEICILVFDEDLNIIDEYDTLIKPPIEIPDYISRITKIENWMVKDKKPFKQHSKKIKKLLQSASLVFGQNVMFDVGVINAEMFRCGRKVKWPKLYCTIENSMHLRGRRLKNAELYLELTGKVLENAHRAKNDILATTEIFKGLRK
mgnify:CR=1 FL=1